MRDLLKDSDQASAQRGTQSDFLRLGTNDGDAASDDCSVSVSVKTFFDHSDS